MTTPSSPGLSGSDATDHRRRGHDRIVQATFVPNQTLTDSSLSAGAASVQITAIEQASLSGGQLMDAGAFSGSVTIQGAAGGNDTIIGAAGADFLDANGGSTEDEIRQSADADQILSDTLLTGRGPDTLAGGFDLGLSRGWRLGQSDRRFRLRRPHDYRRRWQ